MNEKRAPAGRQGALVTGGSRGIGRAVTKAFAREGARVAVNHLRDGAAAVETLVRPVAISRAEGHGEGGHIASEADVGIASEVT